MNSSTLSKRSLCLRRITVKGELYYLLVKEKEQDGSEIYLSDGKTGWIGSVNLDKLKGFAKQLDMEENKYMRLSLSALHPQSEAEKLRTSFDVLHDSKGTELIWKKEMDTGVKFKLGSVLLGKEEEKRIPTGYILDVAVDHLSSLNNGIKSLEQTNEQLLQERERTLKYLEGHVDTKEKIEKDLYQKFAVVLNDKKAKIRELKDEVTALRKGGIVLHPGNSKDEESGGGDEDTDDEKQREEEVKLHSIKRKIDKTDIKESILLAADNDEVDNIPAVKRKRALKKDKTCPATVIPRTVSLPRPQKQGSLSHSSKGRSVGSSKSSCGSLDAEDLIDGM